VKLIENLLIILPGATLTAEKKTIVWNPAKDDEEEYPERANKLIVKQILLGVEAKADEYNVVEVCNNEMKKCLL
jgi:hypothetical protein